MLAIDYHAPRFVDHATSAMIHTLAPIEFHNDAGRVRKVTLRCSTSRVRPDGTMYAVPADRLWCTFRAYTARRAGKRTLIFALPIDVRFVRVRHATTQVFEDFSGKQRIQAGVEASLDPQDG